MQLKGDHILVQMEKHTQKCTFLGILFAQGRFFFCQQTRPYGVDVAVAVEPLMWYTIEDGAWEPANITSAKV